nr:meiotic recombination protein REC114 [Chrysemys picta bellii]
MAAADEVGCIWLGRKLSVTTSEPAGTLPCSVSEQARGAGTVSPLSSAETWPLKRYGRFVSPGAPPCGAGASASWKVLESNEESGHLILTIVVSGHFFISQRRAVQEGFSLIDAHKWLKIVRRADCLLFGSKLKVSCIVFSAIKIWMSCIDLISAMSFFVLILVKFNRKFKGTVSYLYA